MSDSGLGRTRDEGPEGSGDLPSRPAPEADEGPREAGACPNVVPVVSVETLVVLDELDARMRLTAARVSMLARDAALAAATSEGMARTAALLAGAASLSKHVPELAPVSDELAEAASRSPPSPGIAPEALGDLVLAHLDRAAAGDGAALERAVDRAALLAAEEVPSCGPAAVALARVASLTGEERFGEAAARAVDALTAEGTLSARESLLAASALVALGGAEMLERARAIHERAEVEWFAAGGPGESDPVATAAWLDLSCGLWEAEREARYLDGAERALVRMLFEQTEGGGAVVGRTLDGGPGSVDDERATPALARGLAAACGLVLASDPDGGLVAGVASNASAMIRVGESGEMRCTVSTQLPVRGWTRWTFEPVKVSQCAPAGDSTRRPGRRRRMLRAAGEPTATKQGPGPAAFAFSVRVPGWAGGGSPTVKVDGQKASVKSSGGYLRFEVPTDRVTEIEVVLEVPHGIVERGSAASWAREVALSYGPLMLTASARLNPAENLGLPLRLVSEPKDIELVADIRRRLPVVRAEALAAGGGKRPVLFSPLTDVGGFSEGLGGVRPVRCVPFRTWHRWGR